ncbi:hypothetical protein [Sphingobium sp. TKS]|uniref:hypothetical protein n=1 Tax=Sphingobium sp. TKS TaxID=1315974 RepID=UPI0007703F05|nr:hypothetical protein [Sphingobium sp. TKS]AMK26248.1 hypothetical protein K426_26745 [Sphingobium sp. TKS]
MIITFIALACAAAVTAFLAFGRFARTDSWRATVTPLASIIGSGFLICGPILAREFGRAAIIAEAILLLIAYAAGAVIRFNIVHVENYLGAARSNDPVAWLARVTQGVLAIAYAVSVAYYLKLLAEFLLKPLDMDPAWHTPASNAIVTTIIVAIVALAFGNGLRRVEHLAHGTVALKIGIIAGLLVALACWWLTNAAADPLPPVRVNWGSISLLLGLVITVQGFETSRYLGHAYDQALRIRTMRHAQWIASAIYLAFLALLTPFLGRAAQAEGVAGILDIMTIVAPAMAIFVLVGAVSSQLSAAVADSIGSGGLMSEVTQRRLSIQAAFALAGTLAVAIVWFTNPFEVVAISSRAFALFYALQCSLAFVVARRTAAAGWPRQMGFCLIGMICLIAALVGAPAEG